MMKYIPDVVTLELDTALCTGCGACEDVCPRGVFAVEERKAKIVDRDLCIECGACALNCPSGAIQVRSGTGCAAAILKSRISGGEPTCGCCGESNGSSCC